MRRKLAAIVAADIVGYSRRLSQDESGTLAAMDALRKEVIEPALQRHCGRIFRFVGDSTLMEFESALGAVAFAIEVQQQLADLNAARSAERSVVLRMGLDVGDVVLEGNEIHGEGINIAVRLEKIAEPGGICLSDSIHSQTRNRIDAAFLPMGRRSLKNIAEPVQVWQWLPQPSARSAPPQGKEPSAQALPPELIDLLLRLHARSAQLAISNALDDLLADETPQRRVKFEQFYDRMVEELALSRAMLDGVRIARKDEPAGRPQHGLGEFIASLIHEDATSHMAALLPQAEAILRGAHGAIAKRRLFLDMVRRYHDEEFVVRARMLIGSASLD